ncbi:RAB11-binding protein RELCH homolog [Halictus rubicundus]|uniref:RAB11-binding protein RELCH homolog n=1 Tax=Halictus rubicundus TaxID=77578 RepID=UPI0040367239
MVDAVQEVRDPLSTDSKGYPASKTCITYEEIATKLLNDKFLLTALELHVELREAGKELLVLQEFFSNPSNFEGQNIKPEPFPSMPRSSSQATLDSLDMTRYSEDGAGVDEKVAILEFELRKARECISALRTNLTVVTESDVPTPDKCSDKHLANEPPIKPHEQRALNFLVNEYLLARSYKLTSITFSDENENQDFEDWQDVGLNIPKPAELLQIYREYMRANGYEKAPSAIIGVQTDFNDVELEAEKDEFKQLVKELEELKQQTAMLEQEKVDLQQIIATTNESLSQNPNKQGSSGTIQTLNSSSTTPDKFELLETPPRDTSTATHEPEEDDSVSVVVSLGETDPGDKEWTRIQLPRVDVTEGSSILPNPPSRHLPLKFKMEVITHCLVNIPSSIVSTAEEPFRNGVTRDNLVHILAETLPRIVPNVILNKREEVIPLILSVIRLHAESAEREKFLQLLFNLKKRPQEDERQLILAGLVAMAKLENDPMEGEEILTICWEQSQYKYPEKRLLAVECCCALAPYMSVGIRNSLMLSMLQQMLLDDKDPMVRACVVKSLALLIALMDDPDKYFQCEELALTALNDSSPIVVEVASSLLLPILAQWALSLRRLQTHLLPRIISKVKTQLKSGQYQHSPNKDHINEGRTVSSINVLQYLLPHMVICVADTDAVRSSIEPGTSSELSDVFLYLCQTDIVNPKVFYEGDLDVGTLLNTFFANTWENDTWPELEWFTNKLIMEILEMVKSIEITHETILHTLLTYIRSLCLGFGRYITQTRIQPIFASDVSELEQQLTVLSTEKKNMNLTIMPTYLILLSTLNGTEVAKSLKEFLVALSMSGISITCLQIAVIMLCADEHMQEYVLSGLWDGVVHQRPVVRCATATIFGCVIAHVSDRLASAKVVPAIVTLVSDPDMTVRCAAIPSLGRLITECKVREMRDKARLTLENIAKDPQGVPPALALPLVSTLALIAPNCPQNYIEDVIATQLTTIASFTLQQGRKFDLINALVEAFSVLVYCPLSYQCVSNVLLPGLKCLEQLVAHHLPQQEDAVKSLLREIESRQDLSKPMKSSLSMNSGLLLSMATANVGQGVEDMRQKVSKIFQQKSSSSSMSSILRKK